MTRDERPLVYSTDGGRVQPPPERERGKQQRDPRRNTPNDGVVRVSRTSTGRGGKTVTVVTGLPGSPAELDAVLKDLKRRCGTGGSREGRDLAIQGDQRERIVAALKAAGHSVKLAGG
jgi:translation initiation factor 1